ncbi:MAG: response regulator [PS1 clade bacterium]|jgi:two-component system catabolic regulation response regulator CreB
MNNILIVEDERVTAESIVFALESDSFSAHWLTSGREALSYIESSEVDLVLLDIGLPDISGFDVLRKIRKNSNVPVIIITARDDDADIVLGLEGLGADDYVTKPLSPRVLVARVRAQLRHTEPEPITNVNELFSIDENLQQISLKGSVLNLTLAESKILQHLINNPNRVHTRDHLIGVIWDRPVGADTRTIDTHIASIRSSINEVDIENDYIKTHRGLGYSLII